MQSAAKREQPCTKQTKRCTRWMVEVDSIRPPCCTDHLKEILFYADELLIELGIVHWIDFGTLLGAVRHQAMIPWDRDVDISFVDSEPSLMPLLVQLFQEAGYWVKYNPAIPDELKINYSEQNHLHLDLYAYRRADDGMMCMKWAHNSENWFFPDHFLDKLEPVMFYDRQLMAPAPLHEFLADHRYGPNYLTPVRTFGIFPFLLAPGEYTPTVIGLLQELQELVYTNIHLKAQVKALPTISTETTSPQPPVADRLARLIRNSYKVPMDERIAKWGPFWASLQQTKLLEKRVQRKYNVTLGEEEITPAAYLLLDHIACEKSQLNAFEQALAQHKHECVTRIDHQKRFVPSAQREMWDKPFLGNSITKPKAHLLHIGKTGGTAVWKALEPYCHAGTYEIIIHPHSTQLRNVPVGEPVCFLLRHPVTRFVSGFNSRLRCGRPFYRIPWSQGEAEAFACFQHANELAEALSDEDDFWRQQAHLAMRNIQHVKDSFWDWLGDPDYFAARRADILFVGFQETLDADFQRLLPLLGLDPTIKLPTSPTLAHRAPDTLDPALLEVSALGRRNLCRHYAADVAFYEEMKAHHSVVLG